MASILKKILRRWNAGEPKGSSEGAFVAAFGKHPGWDDHIDDIGLDTDVLIAVKRLLYIEGIGANLDAGSWDRLDPEQRVDEFGHVFLWLLKGDVVVGRLWSSRDGKGRARYPMVVCIQCSGLPLLWVLTHILPHLERIEAACVGTTSPGDVRRIMEAAQSEVQQLVRQRERVPAPGLEAARPLAWLAKLPEMGPNRQGLHRVLYHLDREVGQGPAGAERRQAVRPTALRVPASWAASREVGLAWIRFLRARFGADTSILALTPLKNPWIDVIIGEPTSVQMFCLRAALGALPLTNTIPYSMDSEFVARTNQLIDDFQAEPTDKSRIG
ncbi:MAG: hypothetical protein JW741_29965 [Sedimentisphaerales bacterium]|nr:hypothetical protein [Sedimentisphaerales bacterium]